MASPKPPGWLVFLSLLMVLALAVPKTVFDADSKDFILLIGAVGIWRYSMGGVHFLRGMLFLHVVYPYYRRRVRQLGSAADPSHVFLMVTSFIDALTTAMAVYQRSVIREAIDSGYPTTVVCSIVEMSDEVLVRSLWEKMNPPDRVSLDFVRIPGTGKRDGLAYGFRAISRHPAGRRRGGRGDRRRHRARPRRGEEDHALSSSSSPTSAASPPMNSAKCRAAT